MNKKIIGCIALIIILIGVGIFAFTRNQNSEEEKQNIASDISKLKEEYEALNGKSDEEGNTYYTITVNDANVTYNTEEEILKILKEGTGIILFGDSKDNTSRKVLNPLLRSTSDNNMVLHYLDTSNIRSKYEVKENKLEKVKDNSEGFTQILELLKNETVEYKITKDKIEYNTKEKTILPGTVITVYEGEIIVVSYNTYENQDNFEESLYQKYNEFIGEIKDGSCGQKKDQGC